MRTTDARTCWLVAPCGKRFLPQSGGEPLLHPDLDEIIRRIRSHRLIATVITSGYLLTVDRDLKSHGRPSDAIFTGLRGDIG